MTEKLKDYQRVCDRCNESFRTTSKSSRICYKCSKHKFRSAAHPDEGKEYGKTEMREDLNKC